MPDLRALRQFLFAAAMLCSGPVVCAQGQVAEPDATVGAALRSLAARAGVAFIGQVVRIERRSGVVEIAFRVDQSVLGVAGSSYTLREWAGLWPPGQHRYVVGQRLMIFLHAGSAVGLSSPVDGMEGIVPVVPQGANAAALLDVRRLNARLLRTRGTALAHGSEGALALADAVKVVSHWREPIGKEPAQVRLPQLPGASSAEPASIFAVQDSANVVR